MQLGYVAAGEQPGRFEHDINVEIFPREIRRIALLQNLNFVAAYDDILVIVSDFAVEFAVHRIPFQQMSEGVRVSEIIDGEDLLDLFLRHGAKDVASDAPETVNCVVGHRKVSVKGLKGYTVTRKTPNV